MKPQIQIFADVPALVDAAAKQFIACAQAAISARGIFQVALSGGSTPRPLFALLASTHRKALDWEAVRFWWGDERCVPPDHADSNYRMAREALLEPLAVPAMQVARMVGEAPNREGEALRYAGELERALPRDGDAPIFDLMLLGMGADGHTASLFPGTGAVKVRDQVVVRAVPPAYVKPAVDRISVTAPVIEAAREIHALIAGADKAEALVEVLEGTPDLDVRPAGLLRSARGQVRVFVDAAAAARLSRP
jgi:6-phosphogluconolactonase